MGANEQPVVMQRHRVTVDEYYRMGETGILAPDARVELIDGEVVDTAPMKSANAWAVNWLADKLHEAARGQALVTCQTPLRLGDRAEPQPDLMLVRPRPEGYGAQHPGPADVLLVIEVADTSLDYDRRVKMPLYARHGLPEAWIVDFENRQLRLYRRPAGEAYTDITATETPGRIAVAALPDVSIDLDGLFG